MSTATAASDIALYRVEGTQYLLTSGPDFISCRLRQGQVWEKTTLDISQLLLTHARQPVVIDIGANLGAYAVPMGLFIKPKGGRLYAFEPQRQVFYQLCGNFFANQLSNCYAFNQALGESSGEVEIPVLDLATTPNAGALSLDAEIRAQQGWGTLLDAASTEKVAMTTLDILQLPKPDLIKIDVEGLELEVLKGGRKWLAASGNPPLLFEVWGEHMKALVSRRNRLMNLVEKGLGYETFTIGELCIAQHPERKLLDFEKSGDEIKISLRTNKT